MNKRQELIQKRDAEFAQLMDVLRSGKKELPTEEIANQLEKIHDLVLVVDMNKDLDHRVTEKRLKGVYGKLLQIFETKHIRTLVLVFIAGMILTLIPTLLYISSLKDNKIPALEYIPNSVGERKPDWNMAIKTQEQVDMVKNSGIMDAKLAEIGAFVSFGSVGAFVLPADEAKSPEYTITYKGPQEDKAVQFKNTTFIPDNLFTYKQLKMQVIHTSMELEQAKHSSWLNNKDGLDIGAAIRCPESGDCFVLHKNTLNKEYNIITSMDTYRPAEKK